MAQGRSLWREVFINFINSLKPGRFFGEFKGEDYLGNKYYESPNSSYGGRQRRWFVPANAPEVEDEIPTEWDAWLRHRRKIPPTAEEMQLNKLRMEKVKNKTDKVLESKSSPPSSFPQYEEYSTDPFAEKKEKKSP